jgi:hypothetical protein
MPESSQKARRASGKSGKGECSFLISVIITARIFRYIPIPFRRDVYRLREFLANFSCSFVGMEHPILSNTIDVTGLAIRL